MNVARVDAKRGKSPDHRVLRRVCLGTACSHRNPCRRRVADQCGLDDEEVFAMTYEEAFNCAVEVNAETRRTVFIVKYVADEWYTVSWGRPAPGCVLVGEVRRRTPR